MDRYQGWTTKTILWCWGEMVRNHAYPAIFKMFLRRPLYALKFRRVYSRALYERFVLYYVWKWTRHETK